MNYRMTLLLSPKQKGLKPVVNIAKDFGIKIYEQVFYQIQLV